MTAVAERGHPRAQERHARAQSRHTRACRGYLDVSSTDSDMAAARLPRRSVAMTAAAERGHSRAQERHTHVQNRHTRACRGYLDVSSTDSDMAAARLPRRSAAMTAVAERGHPRAQERHARAQNRHTRACRGYLDVSSTDSDLAAAERGDDGSGARQ